MNKKLQKTIILGLLIALSVFLFGCEKIKDTHYFDDEVYDFSDEYFDAYGEELTIVINGYEFMCPSNYGCFYSEGIGPVIYVSDAFQMKLVVRDKSYKDIQNEKDMLTQKTIDAGGKILKDVSTISFNNSEYIYFDMDLMGDECLVIYTDSPDHNKSFAGQIVKENINLTDEDYINAFDTMVSSAKATDKPESNYDDVMNRESYSYFDEEEETETIDFKNGLTTYVEHDNVYNYRIKSKEEAKRAIKEYASFQRLGYYDEEILKIEKELEDNYDIIAVNLGEMDVATAYDVKKACDYMFNEYPQIKGTLTNLTIANFKAESSSNIAVTECREFIINKEFAVTPFVVKYAIELNASKFFNRDKLLKDCEEQVAIGHWPEGMDITTLVVHELGHQLLDVYAMKEFGLIKDNEEFSGFYITDKNIDSYSYYLTDLLAANQTVPKKVIDMAYDLWINSYGMTGSQDEFRESISGYASGIQEDGGISYPETIAEAVADVYLNGDKARNASLAIVSILK